MAKTQLGDNTVNTVGELPVIGSTLPEFVLVGNDMKDVRSESFSGKKLVLNIFPSIGTSVCPLSIREFNKRITAYENAVVLCISKDIPFAMKHFCGAEGIDKAITLSDFRNQGFGKNFGVELMDGNFRGLFARAVIVTDASGKVKYTELVPKIGQEPNYEAALKAL